MDILKWIIIAVVVAGILIALLGWDRYRGGRKSVDSAAEPTSEVFIDPANGQRMRVWYSPATGRREYRPDEGQ
jgi:hypothetical protein